MPSLRFLVVFVYAICLQLLHATAALDEEPADVGVQVDSDHVVGVPSTDSELWSSLLYPSDEIEFIQNDPSLSWTLQLTEAESESSLDFWEEAKKNEVTLRNYVPRLLESMTTFFKSNSFSDVKSAMDDIVQATATFRESIQDALDSRHVTFDEFSEELETAFMEIVHKLRETADSSETPPGDDEREVMFRKLLDDIESAVINLALRYGIDTEIVNLFFRTLKPQVLRLLVAAADINQRYPRLFAVLAFIIVVMMIPQLWFLKPLLQIFGFGVAGPIKGSIAAWLQGYFWGAAAQSGSWFALLQAAGMGTIPWWAGLAVKIPFIGGVLGTFFNRA